MPVDGQEKIQEPKERAGIRERLIGLFRIDESKYEPLFSKLFRSVASKYSVTGFSEAFALGFYRYIGHSVEFPAFPNLLDSIGMGLIGSYLVVDALRPKINDSVDKMRAALKLGLGAVAFALSISFPESFNHFSLFQASPNDLYTIGFGAITFCMFAETAWQIKKNSASLELKLREGQRPEPVLPRIC